jgi:hypothetical protein
MGSSALRARRRARAKTVTRPGRPGSPARLRRRLATREWSISASSRQVRTRRRPFWSIPIRRRSAECRREGTCPSYRPPSRTV